MQNLLEELKDILLEDQRLVADGKLLKNKITELTLQTDPALLKLLLKHPEIKRQFFSEVDDLLVFDRQKFLKFINNKAFLPDSYTAFKNKIGLSSEGEFLAEAHEMVLSWPFKDCVLKGGQTKEDKQSREHFLNVILSAKEIDRLLSPKVLTQFKLYSSEPKTVVTNITIRDNLIIKGNNLLALHSLAKVFRDRIKLIYIDPPYNTGNDSFRYHDNFSHSTWLTFMKNRLEIARELLSNDGCILIQIDNNEGSYLKVLCDEVFGRSNYRNSIIVKKGTKSLQKQFKEIQKLNAGYDTILLYTKNDTVKLPNLFKELNVATSSSWNNHWRGTNRRTMRFELFGIKPESGQWRWEKNRTNKAVENFGKLCDYIRINEGEHTEITDDLIDTYYRQYFNEYQITDPSDFELVRLSRTGKPEHYIPPRMKVLLSENWMDLSVAGRVTKFEHEKNEEILKRIIQWLSKEGDTVLDFFLGSGSTAAVCHKTGRQYIGVEQMDYGEDDAVARLQSVIKGEQKGISPAVKWKGGGSFIYCELAQLNQKMVDRIVSAGGSELEKIYDELSSHPYIDFRVETEILVKEKAGFSQLNETDKKNVLLSLLDHNQLYVNYSEMDDADISEEDKRLNTIFYNLK